MEVRYKDKLEQSLEKFLPKLNDPDFFGVVVSVGTRFFHGNSGLFNKAIRFFKKYDPNLIIHKQPMRLTFSSGAIISFTSIENTCGLQISAAMILVTPNLKNRDVLQVQTRLRRPCVGVGKYWFFDLMMREGG